MNMQGLSLDQAPPYRVPLLFYITGVCYLLVFVAASLFLACEIDSRYHYEAIAITHLMTLGFFSHAMFGTLFQMVPVIIGEAYENVQSRAKWIYAGLNLGTWLFAAGFLSAKVALLHIAMTLLLLAILSFALYSFMTIKRTIDKNGTVMSFLAAQIFLAFGALLGAAALLSHAGLALFTNIAQTHMPIIFYGWVFMLICGVAYRVIPMFYVALEYPLWMKRHLFWTLSVCLALYFVAVVIDIEAIQEAAKIALALLSTLFALTTIKRLYTRKRARSDTTVHLWYFAMSNLAFGSVVWLGGVLFELNVDFTLGVVFGVGFIYALINGMLYKIVPFLTWFHLSSAFVFEAEMSEVIKASAMRLQFRLFAASYAFFMAALVYRPLLYAALVLFGISAAMLLYNIVGGYNYHKKMILKAPNYGQK